MSEALSIEQVLDDIRQEPSWRRTANREWAYYDCKQLDADVIAAMESAGMLPIMRPLIPAAIDAVLGIEAKTRRDGMVFADEDKDSDIAKALGSRLHEIERLSGADAAISDAYGGQVRVGVGWVEVGRNHDPFGFWHRCSSPHRREIWWDWRSGTDPDNWRYVVRKAWFDADRLAEMFPQQANLIRGSSKAFPDWANRAPLDVLSTNEDAEALFWQSRYRDLERGSSFEEREWRETDRARLCLWEVVYREWKQVDLLRFNASDMVIEFDKKNINHQMMLMGGMAELDSGVIPRPRLAYWVGPHKLADIPSPYSHGKLWYVPFFGLTDDSTNMPYGLIRRMVSTQDSINAGLTKMHHLMTSTMVMGDSDAFEEDLDDLADRLGQKNSVVALNPRRTNSNQRPEIRTDRELSAQHFGVLQEAQRILPEMAGIYQAMQGKSIGDQSGVAIAALVEQGQIGLAKINQNYAAARKSVLTILLANEIDRMKGKEMQVVIEKNRKKVTVFFNEPVLNQNGYRTLNNDLMLLQTRVDLADVPATATYKQQLMAGLLELAKSIPDAMKAPIITMVIRATDYPEREEIAAMLEQQMGLGDGERDPTRLLDERRKAALDHQAQQLSMDAAQAKVDGEKAKTDKLQAEVQELSAKVAQMLSTMRRQEQDAQIQQAIAQGQMVPMPAPQSWSPPAA